MNPSFLISGTAGRIAMKFGVWLETNHLRVLLKSREGYICTCARRTPFPYLGNGGAECAKIWCVVRDPLSTRFPWVSTYRVGRGILGIFSAFRICQKLKLNAAAKQTFLAEPMRFFSPLQLPFWPKWAFTRGCTTSLTLGGGGRDRCLGGMASP